jgi:hypothetical protein
MGIRNETVNHQFYYESKIKKAKYFLAEVI